MSGATPIHWSRRVSPGKIRRFYESDAQGMLDEDLLNDVGYGIYCRCQDILQVCDAWRGKVTCRGCGTIVPRRQGKWVEYTGHGPTLIGGQDELLACDHCGWQMAWAEYRKSTAGKNLGATGLEELFGTFVEQWPVTRSPHDRLPLVDTLIHAFHCWDGNTVGSPIGTTVIRATGEELLVLLDELAYGTASTRGLDETRQRWASQLAAKKKQHSLTELRSIARELNLRGRSRMSKAELERAIRAVAPERLGCV